MDSSNSSIDWTKNLELYLKEVGEHSLCLGMLHKKCESKFSAKALCIDLPVIVISTLCGSLTLSAKSMFGEEFEDSALKIVGAFSLFSGILGTIQAYFSYSRRAENHRNSYLEYTKLYRFVKVELGLPRKSRIRPKDLLKLINDQFERLNELSQLVPEDVVSTFQKKYKSSTIDRPPELNGLDEIKIYIHSDVGSVKSEESTSIRQTINVELQNRAPPTHVPRDRHLRDIPPQLINRVVSTPAVITPAVITPEVITPEVITPEVITTTEDDVNVEI